MSNIQQRRNFAAAELLIDALDISQDEADKWVLESREWFRNNKPDMEDLADLWITGFDLAMRASYLYGMNKRLEM